MSNRVYRILGGPKHGEFIELEAHQKTLLCVIPVHSLASYSPASPDEVFRTGKFEYEKSIFAFPHVMEDVEVLAPKGSTSAEREQYLIDLIKGVKW